MRNPPRAIIVGVTGDSATCPTCPDSVSWGGGVNVRVRRHMMRRRAAAVLSPSDDGARPPQESLEARGRALRRMSVPEPRSASLRPTAREDIVGGARQIHGLQQAIRSFGDRDGALGVLPQRRAGDAEIRGLLLNAPRIRDRE